MSNRTYLLHHRAHDSLHLIERWKALARAAKLELQAIHTAGDLPVLFLRSKHLTADALYISAGVHGDEPAPPTALLEWAEENKKSLARAGSNLVLFPLFNPVGLMLNTRANEQGIDLNRLFHDTDHPHIAAWHRAIGGLHFRLGVMLHEDYDGQGIYCYELNAGPLLASKFLEGPEKVIPRDPRASIDGRTAKNAVIQRKKAPLNLPGLPEAIVLYQNGAPATLTFESPSEYSLQDRVQAQKAFINAVFHSK